MLTDLTQLYTNLVIYRILKTASGICLTNKSTHRKILTSNRQVVNRCAARVVRARHYCAIKLH